MGFIQSIIGFIGRALFALYFLANGVQMVMYWEAAEQALMTALNEGLNMYLGNSLIQETLEWASSHLFGTLAALTICQLLGGLMLFLGMGTRMGAFLLLLYLVPVTCLDHHFWMLHGPERNVQMMLFLQHTALAGGLLVFLSYGRGSKKMKIHSPVVDEE